MNKSCVHIYYGDGKGKTTAGLGLLLRAKGQGLSCILSQFLKATPSGELSSLKALDIPVLRCQQNPEFLKFFFQMSPEEQAAYREAQQALFSQVKTQILSGAYGLAVLDEVLDACQMGIVDPAALEELVVHRGDTELVLTGHGIWPEIAQSAHYITHMQKEKHPYDTGLKGRRGIEF